ncbi:hypothetical protein ACLD0W_17085 [Alloalcanivorax sp. C16-1]|uniref:hypothetical protein n=1 Tax=Alloalcanivorax sp. C16-1 TaxID=3390051 RepID=UPI0039709CB6
MSIHTSRATRIAALALPALLLPGLACAYVGPGAGLSLLTALWGIVAAIGVALLFVIMWPIRRLRRRRKAAADESAARVAEPPVDETPSGHTDESPRPGDDDRRV